MLNRQNDRDAIAFKYLLDMLNDLIHLRCWGGQLRRTPRPNFPQRRHGLQTSGSRVFQHLSISLRCCCQSRLLKRDQYECCGAWLVFSLRAAHTTSSSASDMPSAMGYFQTESPEESHLDALNKCRSQTSCHETKCIAAISCSTASILLELAPSLRYKGSLQNAWSQQNRLIQRD